MSDLLESILRFVENFSAKRLFLLVCLLLAVGCGAFFYERYTATFSLSRLERIAVLAKELEGSRAGVESEKKVAEIQRSIVDQLHALTTVGENNRVTSLVEFKVPANAWLWKFIAGAAPWLLVGLAAVISSKQNFGGLLSQVFGILVFSATFAGIGAWMPTIGWPWFNLLIYPGLTLLIVILPAAIPKIFALRKSRDANLRKAILNQLRMLSAAADQYFLENGVSEVDVSQLVGPSKFIKSLISVNGEVYSGMIKLGQAISVTTKDGEVISYQA